MLVTVFETTERHLADKRRNESEALLRIALEGGGMGAWWWDIRNGLTWGDTQFLALWGFPPSNDPHSLKLFIDRMSPTGAAEIDVLVAKALERGYEFDGELEIVAGPAAGRYVTTASLLLKMNTCLPMF